MVGSAGLDTVRARCCPLVPSSDLAGDDAMIHQSDKSPTITHRGLGVNLTSSYTEDPAATDVSASVRDSPSKSSCTNIERPSPNCAIYDFKHQDTDTEEAAANTATSTDTAACQANLNLVECDPARNRIYQVRRRGVRSVVRTSARTRLEFSCDEEVDHEALQKIIDSAILDPDWLNSNMPSDSEASATEDEAPLQEHMDTGSDGGTPGHPHPQQEDQVAAQNQPLHQEAQRTISKESITRLVSDAERLVREPPEGDQPAPLVSPRPHQLPLNMGPCKGAMGSKQARVRQWLASQRREARLSTTCVMDSCDASGELTTGESDIESCTSEDMDASTATQHAVSTRGSVRGSQKGSLKGSRDPLPSTDNTPTAEKAAAVPSPADAAHPKVVLRSRKRRSGEQRPCSVSELYQLATRLDLAPFSVSETALHNLLTATPETPTNDNQAFGAETPDAAGSNTSPTDVSTPTTTGPPATPATNTTKQTITSTTHPNISASATITTSTTSTTADRQSPATNATGSLRRRKTRARRKSNLSLGRRTDSGSDGLALNLSGGSDNNQVSPNRRLSKSHSSGSDTASHCRRHIVKSSSFSGACRGGSGGMTSSTEKCVSDCGGVLGVPRLHTRAPRRRRLLLQRRVPPIQPGAGVAGSHRAKEPRPHRRSATQSDQDALNTHEDMSSLSEQAWDPYQQEYKYFSEPYSEDIDQEAARRLLEFGDDYRKYIDSDGASSFSGIPHRGRRSPHHRRLRSLIPQGARDLDSDSDLDDLHHVIDESRSQLTVTENVLKKYSNEAALGLDYVDIFFYLAMPDFIAVTVGGSPIAITFTSDNANIAYHLTFLAAISRLTHLNRETQAMWQLRRRQCPAVQHQQRGRCLVQLETGASAKRRQAELVATTQTNIKCLAEIVRHLQMEGTLEPELQEVQMVFSGIVDDSSLRFAGVSS
nr:uncharacterized protein LOC113808579 [Penaeus vannamei]